jgi:energy-coupling factor transporter transmembrane protein EcfT
MSEEGLTSDIKEHVKDTNVWLRLLFMLLFVIIYSAAEVVLAVVVFFQFLCVLFTGNKNGKALLFGSQLSAFAYQVFSYLTYNSEERPFPFADWPSGKLLSEETVKPKRRATPRKRAVKKEAPKPEEEKPTD